MWGVGPRDGGNRDSHICAGLPPRGGRAPGNLFFVLELFYRFYASFEDCVYTAVGRHTNFRGSVRSFFLTGLLSHFTSVLRGQLRNYSFFNDRVALSFLNSLFLFLVTLTYTTTIRVFLYFLYYHSRVRLRFFRLQVDLRRNTKVGGASTYH